MATGFDVGGFRYAHYGNPGPTGPGQEQFGWEDVKAAQSQGASALQIYQLADRATRERGQQLAAGWTRPISIGGQVMNKINQHYGGKPQAPHNWTYENYGGYGFGHQDLYAVGDHYSNLDKIKELRNFAQSQGLNIGGGINERLTEMSGEARDARHMEFQRELAEQQAERDRLAQQQAQQFQADMLAQQQAAAAEQARIQEEAAAQAARVKGNTPTGVGGAATIKGSRLQITEAGGSRGTKRFTRPGTQYLNTLGIGAAAAPTGQSTLNL